jgi:hypothetical protein
MRLDLPSLIRRTQVLIETSEALFRGSMRAIEKSQRLVDTIDAGRTAQTKAQPIRAARKESPTPDFRENP